jgi:hypothetical protein
MELDACQVEELLLELAGEDWITIADDGAWHSREAHNLVKDGACDGCGGVGVTERHEVCVLGEVVHDCRNDCLAVDARKSLDKVHGYVSLDH